jgi:hypothetical protein
MAERLKLRRVVDPADFRLSEASNMKILQSEDPDLVASLKGDECVLFVSGRGDQLVFVYGFRHFADLSGKVAIDRIVLPSRRYRIIGGGEWNPKKLANYAADVGIELEGRRKYDEAHALRAEVMRERHAARDR